VVQDAWTTRRERDQDLDAVDPPARTHRRPSARDGDEVAPLGRAEDAWINRGLGALAAGATAAWLARHALTPAPAPPALLALICAGATLLLPRLGWLTLIAAAAILTAAQGHSGLSLLIVPAGLLAVVLIPWHPTAWPLPAGAVGLGLIGVAGAWPAVASWASSPWRRAALGAAGWIWLLLAAPIVGHALYLDWTPASSLGAWSGSIRGTLDVLITPMVGAGVVAPAAVWAIAAAVLPWLVRGRSLVLDALLVVIWSATVVSACTAAIAAIHGAPETSTAPDAVLGAVAGAGLALGRVWLPYTHARRRPAWAPLRARGRALGPESGVGPQFP
jgi:hypothetical protein